METVTREMIEWLREKASVSIVGRGGPEVVVEKAMLERVADMLEHYSYMNELAENRKYRKRYVEWWRKKNGESDLTYPDFDNVYKDFWKLMDTQNKWVRTSDRLPKVEDGTECGCVIGYDSKTNCVIECYVESVVNNPERITWWQPFPGLPEEVKNDVE